MLVVYFSHCFIRFVVDQCCAGGIFLTVLSGLLWICVVLEVYFSYCFIRFVVDQCCAGGIFLSLFYQVCCGSVLCWRYISLTVLSGLLWIRVVLVVYIFFLREEDLFRTGCQV